MSRSAAGRSSLVPALVLTLGLSPPAPAFRAADYTPAESRTLSAEVGRRINELTGVGG
jgi:hypothetical protein